MAYRVFVSYSTRNLNVAQWARQALAQPGVTEVFVAECSVAPGAILNAELAQAIRNCDLFLLLWSHAARTSDYVPQEIGIAFAANRMILPVVMEANVPVPGFISDRKYLRAHQDWEGAFQWLTQFIHENSTRKQNQQTAAALLALIVGGILLLTQGG